MQRILTAVSAGFVLLISACGNLDLPVNENNKNTGSSAHALLSGEPYTRLIIELSHMSGFHLQDETKDSLRTFLERYLDKPGGIEIYQHDVPDFPENTMTLDDIKRWEIEYRQYYSGNNSIAVHILITNGAYSTPDVLGVAYRNTSVALLGKTIHNNSGGLLQVGRTQLETTVLLHEIGHLLGLVDAGTPMQHHHIDNNHGKHCDNNACLMYYQAETTAILGFLLGNPAPGLDSNCVNDLKANGGL